MPERIPQSTTIRIPLQAYLSSNHTSPATGQTIAITISKKTNDEIIEEKKDNIFMDIPNFGQICLN